MMATPSAPPSIGSVPDPTSSSRTSAGVDQRPIHRDDVRDMAGERAEAGLDRLLVADIGEERLKHRHPRSVSGRNPQSRLRHERKQPRCLERDGLAARVRTGNQQDGGRRRHLDRDRNGACEQRMPRIEELERPVARERRLDPVNRLGKPGACLDDVEPARRLDGPLQVGVAAAERIGQRKQDAKDLFMLLFFERDDVVVDFDRAERLEKEAGAARRRAVDDTWNRAAMLGFDDEYIPAVPLGDDLILQMLRRVLAAQVRLEGAPQPRPLLAQPLADGLQLGARVIDDVAGRVDLVSRGGDLAFERGGVAADGLEARKRSCRAADGGSRLVDRIEKRGQREQPVRFERPALRPPARRRSAGGRPTRAAGAIRSPRRSAPLRSYGRADPRPSAARSRAAAR